VARDQVIGVTGSTGELGGRVVERLAALAATQRLIVRDPKRVPSVAGSVFAQASYEDGEAMRRALDGVKTLFMVSARESLSRVAQHASAVDAAVAAGVERIVYLSFVNAAPDATHTFARDHYRTEEHIRASGMGYTFLRPNLYLDRVPHFFDSDGVMRGPGGEGQVAWVSRDDVAGVAAAVLTRGGHDGCTYDVTGPEALTLAQSALELEKVIGRPIGYEPQTIEEARAARAGTGADWEIEGWISSYLAIANGEMATVSDTAAKLGGREPQSLASYLRTHAESYQHLLTARYIQH
jgi:uncharacterized protein YbjT (DUF2867 family)